MFRRVVRVVSKVLGIAVVIFFGVLVYFAIWDVFQKSDTQKSLVIGKTYQMDGPYPATLKVSGTSNMPWHSVVNGDLFVKLPEGSKEIEITRFFGRQDTLYYLCTFYIEFTSSEGTRQTWTWQDCATLNGLLVVPDEIYVK